MPRTTDSAKPYRPGIETKRSRGERACAECTRLKRRCDKKVPCSGCVRRGTALLCPNGISSGGNGPRIYLADADQVYRKLVQMSERIRQLEEALQARLLFNEQHPLLSDDYLDIKKGIDTFIHDNSDARPASPGSEEEDHAPQILETFGTLAITDDGGTRFIGNTGSSEVVLINEASHLESCAPEDVKLPIFHVDTWPFATVPRSANKQELLVQALHHLPPKERLSSLCEIFLENIAWLYRIVGRSQLMEELVPRIYKKLEDPEEQLSIDPHDLALLLVVCAYGAVGDQTLEDIDTESFGYYAGARLALSLKPTFASSSLATIQTLFMMGVYISTVGPIQSLESAWLTISFAMSLAISMGLHRDPSRWNLGPRVEERRRELFWELFVTDHCQGLSAGRPTLFPLYAIDCQFPEEIGDEVDSRGNKNPSYWHWHFQFSREVLAKVTQCMSSCRALKMADIMDLDRRIREFPPHPYANEVFDRRMVEDEGPKKTMRVFTSSILRDIFALYIHRNFFARALRDPAIDPLLTPYATSFISSYRSSMKILQALRRVFAILPSITARCWLIWNHILCSLIVIASVVAMRPQSELAAAAYTELGLTVELFEKASTYAVKIRRILPLALRLHSKASKAYAQYRGLTNGAASSTHPSTQEFRYELAALSGDARILSMRVSTTESGTSRGDSGDHPEHHSDPGGNNTAPSGINGTNGMDFVHSGQLDSLFFDPRYISQVDRSANHAGIGQTTPGSVGTPNGLPMATGDGLPIDGSLPSNFSPLPAHVGVDRVQMPNGNPHAWQDAWDALMNESGIFPDSQSNGDSSIAWSNPLSIL